MLFRSDELNEFYNKKENKNIFQNSQFTSKEKIKKKKILENEITEELLKDIKSALKGCLAYDGVGISANQLGINKSFFLIREDGENFKIYINPKIHSMSQEKLKEKEGCLSVPRYSLLVERSNQIKTSWQEIENNKLIKIEKVLTGFDARVFQHEFDHLQGLSIIDRSCELNRAERRKILHDLSQR